MTRDWTIAGLAALYALSASGASLNDMADALGRMKADCDLALWVLIGRTPDEALAVLRGRSLNKPPPRSRSPLGRFLREVHP